MASGIYNIFKADLMNKELDLEADTIKVALYNNSASFSATDTDYANTNELSTTGGYTQGGAALASKAVTAGATTKWDAADLAWTSATFTAYFAKIYDDTHASNHLICCIDFGGAKTVSAGTFTIVWDAAGIITLT